MVDTKNISVAPGIFDEWYGTDGVPRDLVRAFEVLGSVEHVCCDCVRPIRPGEYKTEIVWYSPNVVWSEYTCCRAPHSVQTTQPRKAFEDGDSIHL